jgi:hypothetical protein
MARRIVWAIGGLAIFAAAALAGMHFYAVRDHDPANPYSRPYGYLMEHTVEIDAAPEAVTDFIVHEKAKHYRGLAGAHDEFTFIEGDALMPGAVFETREFQEDEGVVNRYTVTEVEPGRAIRYESKPSLIYEKRGEDWVQSGTCNTYVRYDIEPAGAGSRVTQTVVIEMPNLFVKFIADMIILGEEGNAWQDHLVEELEQLKAAVEAESLSRP